MSAKYTNWNVEQLKAELRKRNAKTSGRKAELIERLQSYDRNFNFGSVQATHQLDFHLDLPDATAYKDVNAQSQIPPVGKVDADAYLQQFDLQLGDDRDKLYSAGFLKFVRSASEGENICIRAECRAEMRKSVTYTVDVKLNKYANILQCQCECAAGMGPTANCKHVRCLLFALTEFTVNGTVLTEETCTQKLQTFHKAKRFIGSPLIAAALPSCSKNRKSDTSDTTSASHSSSALLFDPRPPSLRKMPGYSSCVRNFAVNFACTSPNMPWMQLYAPANPYAIELDHDYLARSISDSLMDTLHITAITEKVVTEIERQTRGQAANEVWHAERSNRLCSSTFGRICKATSATNFSRLARELCNPTQFSSASTRHGQQHETEAVRLYEHLTGSTVDACGLFVSVSHPFLAASPDGIVSDSLLVEVKCPYTARHKPISPATVPYLFLTDNGELQLDSRHEYFYQIQGQLFATNRKVCHLIVFTIVDMKLVVVERDDIFIDHMVMRLSSFFTAHFLPALKDKLVFHSFHDYDFTY